MKNSIIMQGFTQEVLMQAENTIDTGAVGYRSRRSRRQKALTLIEAAMALGLFALASAFAVTQVATYLENVKARNVAEKMVEVSQASAGYVKANYAALVSSTAIGAVKTIAIGRANATAAPPANSVQEQGFLPSSFIDVNGYGQRHALLVKRVSASRLEALVTTYSTTNHAITDRMLTTIGTYIGNTGGYVLQTPPVAADANKIIGAYGGYRSDIGDWGGSAQRPKAGYFQSSLAFEDGKLLADYLYRNDIGIPEANQMNTAINMQGTDGVRNDINNGGTFNAQNLKATIDVWADNDVVAGRDITSGRDMVATRDIHANRNIIAEQDVIATRDVEAGRNARVKQDLSVTRNATVGNDLTVSANAKIDGQADIATLDLQRTEVLIPGRFGAAQKMKLSDLLGRQVAQYSYVVTPASNKVPKPDCAGGYSKARIFVYRQVDSIKGYPQVRLLTTQQNGYLTSVAQDIPNSFVNIADGLVAANYTSAMWAVSWIGSLPADGATRQAIAQTYCYYG
jgi:hypothetical protein